MNQFHKVRIKKRTPNACAVVATQALLGTDAQRTAMALNYNSRGTLNTKVVNGLAFLTAIICAFMKSTAGL